MIDKCRGLCYDKNKPNGNTCYEIKVIFVARKEEENVKLWRNAIFYF